MLLLLDEIRKSAEQSRIIEEMVINLHGKLMVLGNLTYSNSVSYSPEVFCIV